VRVIDLLSSSDVDGLVALAGILILYPVGTVTMGLVLGALLAVPVALVIYTGQVAARILGSEVAALSRADQGGGTVLGRLAAGFGKKES
jgi:hypothetical protein